MRPKKIRELKRPNRLLEQENEVLRRAAAYLAGPASGKRLYPLVRELAATGAPLRVPVVVAWRVLKLHRQHYYAWLADPVTDSELEEANRANAIFDAHCEDPEFGYRLRFGEVTDSGHQASERTVWKICSANRTRRACMPGRGFRCRCGGN